MNRNSSQEATILSLKIAGENNKSVCFITKEEGICSAMLFGGPKSRLKSLVSPFNRGEIFLYKDRTKNSCKISDFDVKKYHTTFRDSLFKTYAASLAAEIVIKTKCFGSPKESFVLLNGFLDGMELSGEEQSRLGLIRFIWRYLDLSGMKPQTEFCPYCKRSYIAGKFTENDVSLKASYSQDENGFICSQCAGNEKNTFVLSRSALMFLEAVNRLEPKKVRSIIPGGEDLNEIKNFCFYIIEYICGTKLNSLETGLGIL